MTVVTDFTALLSADDNRWNATSGNDTVAYVTYSFVTSNFQTIVSESSAEVLSGYNAFDAAQQIAFRAALDEYEAISGLRFIEVADPADAMIRVMNSADEPDRAGFANFPTISDNTQTLFTSVSSNGVLVMTQGTGVDYSPGTSQYETLLHEIGHAVGLEHPHEGDLTLDPALDNNTNTVMTYVSGPVVDDLGVFDIQALQQIYGDGSEIAGFTSSWDEVTDVFTLTGSGGDDTLTAVDADSSVSGGAGDDVLIGRDGDDTFAPGDGDATISGGTGTDTVVLDGALADYTLQRGGGFDGLALLRDTGDLISVRDIDTFQFSDQTLSYDALKAAVLPDLDLTGGIGGLNDFTAGVARTLTLSMINNGAAPASVDVNGSPTGPLIKVFLAEGTDFDNTAIEVGSARTGVLAPGAFETINIDVTIPTHIAAGDNYRLWLIEDGGDEVFESDELTFTSFIDFSAVGIEVINPAPTAAPTAPFTVTVEQFDSAFSYPEMFAATLINGEFGYISRVSLVYEATDGSGVTAVVTGSGFANGGGEGTITGLTFYKDGVKLLEAQGYQIDVLAAGLALQDARNDDFTGLQAILDEYAFDYTGADDLVMGDIYVGGNNDDTLKGGTGDDTLTGGELYIAGDPLLTDFADDGDDDIDGGAGYDLFVVGGGNDTLDGGADIDTLLFFLDGFEQNAFTIDYNLDLGTGQISTIPGTKDTLLQIENIILSDDPTRIFDATLTGNGLANLLSSIGGDDMLSGLAGDDTLNGGLGDDTLDGGADNDEIVSESGNNLLLGGTGDDTIVGGTGADNAQGGADNDFILGGEGDDTLRGEGGNDTLAGNDGDDVLVADGDEDLLSGGDGQDIFQIQSTTTSTITDFNVTRDTLDLSATGLTVADVNALVPVTLPGGAGIGLAIGAGLPDTFISLLGLTIAEFGNVTVTAADGTRLGAPLVVTVTEFADGNDQAFDTLMLGAILPTPISTTVAEDGSTITIEAFNGNTVIIEGINLVMEAEGQPSSGVITGFEVRSPGAVTLTQATGFSMELTAFYAAIAAANAGDGDAFNPLFDVYSYMVTSSAEGEELSYIGPLDDTLTGNAGNDTLEGDAGDDVLDGGADDDTLDGGAGDDTLDGGTGTDTLTGGNDADTFVSATGNGADIITDFDTTQDVLDLTGHGLSTPDLDVLDLSDASGHLVIGFGGGDSLTLTGLTMADIGDIDVVATDGPRKLAVPVFINGTSGPDILRGGYLIDTINGGNGIDTIEGGASGDQINGGGGRDLVDYSRSDAAVVVNFATNTVSGGHATGDTLTSIEGAIGGAFNDTMTGSSSDNVFTGNGGADRILAGDGADLASGGAGEDRLFGGSQRDTLNGGDDADRLFGENGADVLNGDGGNDTILGGFGNDTLNGGDDDDDLDGGGNDDVLNGDGGNDDLRGRDNSDLLNGGTGNDTLFGNNGSDTLNGGDNDDILWGQAGNDSLNGGNGHDVLNGDDDEDTLIGGEGNDTMDGGRQSDVMDGGIGDDVMDGKRGGDSMDGGAGNDHLIGFAGEDTINGGDDNDTIEAGSNNDLVNGDDGNDSIDGGQGNDTLNGGIGADTINGGSNLDVIDGGNGADVLSGGRSFDTLTGGSGADTFVFTTNDNADVITDFSTTDDTLDLSGTGLTLATINTVSFSLTAGGLMADLGGIDSLVFNNLTLGDEDDITVIVSDGTQTGFDVA